MSRSLVFLFLLIALNPILAQENQISEAKLAEAEKETVVATLSEGSKPIGEEAFAMLSQFLSYDASARLRARKISKEVRQVYTIEKIVFNGANGRRIPAQLAVPRVRVAPYPCVLLIHDLAGSKQDWWDDENLIRGGLVTRQLLATGHAVLCLDLPAHGERTQDQDYEPTTGLAFASQQGSRLRSLLFQGVIDQRRGLDYLETRSEIDTSRLAVTGYGYGGLVALMLTTADPRIITMVGCALPMAEQSHAVFAPRHFAPRITQIPILILAGQLDENAPESQTRNFHQLIVSAQKKLIFYDSNHRLPKQYSKEVLRWLRTRLLGSENVAPVLRTDGN